MYAPRQFPRNSRFDEDQSIDRFVPFNQQFHCWSASASDLLSPSSDEMEQNANSELRRKKKIDSDWKFNELSEKSAKINRSSRTPSIVSTLSTPNILLTSDYQQVIVGDGRSRLRERLAASIAGLKELDILRDKHRKMVEEMKTHLKFGSNHVWPQQNHHSVDGCANGNGLTILPRSPSPAELCSNISHRSSLSMDSGVCLSLASDSTFVNGNGYRTSNHFPYHQRRQSSDSSNGYFNSYLSPARKTSWTMSSASALCESLANATSSNSDDEGCQDGSTNSPRAYNSLASITAALAAAEATVAMPRTNTMAAPLNRYRRRMDASGSSSNFGGSSRPRSLYNCFPEDDAAPVKVPISIPYVAHATPAPTTMRLMRRTSVQYRPQVPTIVANLPESKVPILDHQWDPNTALCRRRSSAGRTSATDPVFRASRIFIDTLPENEVIMDVFNQDDGNYRTNVPMRPRRYETRRPRPTSVAVPQSISTPVLCEQPSPPNVLKPRKQSSSDLDQLEDWRRIVSSFEDEKPTLATRSSSSSTLVRQHSSASVASNGRSKKSPKIRDRRNSASKSPSLQHAKRVNASLINVSVVTTGETCSGSSSCSPKDEFVLDSGDGLFGFGRPTRKCVEEHEIIRRSISSQSSDSNRSKRNKEKTWTESPKL